MLAAGVAHEIGNPLNSLNIHLQLIERRLGKLPRETREAIENSLTVARTEIQRLDSIVHQFLRAIRPTTPAFEPYQLNDLIEESVAFLRPEIEDRDILVETDLDPSLPMVEVDRDQIKQAFYNIIKNAFQAMKTGGILYIKSWHENTDCSFTFNNTGGWLSTQDLG